MQIVFVLFFCVVITLIKRLTIVLFRPAEFFTVIIVIIIDITITFFRALITIIISVVFLLFFFTNIERFEILQITVVLLSKYVI